MGLGDRLKHRAPSGDLRCSAARCVALLSAEERAEYEEWAEQRPRFGLMSLDEMAFALTDAADEGLGTSAKVLSLHLRKLCACYAAR